MSKIKVCVQIYSVLDKYKNNPRETIRKLADAGYDGIEFAGNMPAGVESRQLLSDCGMEAISAHTSIERLENNYDNEVELAKKLQIKNLICQWASFSRLTTIEEVNDISDKLTPIAEALARENICFGYHNHWTELNKINGDYAVNQIVNKKYVQNYFLEFDVFWAEVAGTSAIDFLKENRKQCKALFFKDYISKPRKQMPEDQNFIEKMLSQLCPDRSIKQVPIGEGEGKYKEILQMSSGAENIEWIVVEQTDFGKRDPFECLECSCRFIKDHLIET